MPNIMEEISTALQQGRVPVVKERIQAAVAEGLGAQAILQDGLLAGMGVIGEKFKANTVYIPEVMLAARAMNAGMELLRPEFSGRGPQMPGRVCIGTVKGDLHDIGKNLVRMMMESKGIEVIDLGVDVAPETFVETAKENNCKIIACSALLTTTMPVMADVVKAVEAAGIRDQVKIMIGGAPVSEQFCESIGADKYTPDAASAAEAAAELLTAAAS